MQPLVWTLACGKQFSLFVALFAEQHPWLRGRQYDNVDLFCVVPVLQPPPHLSIDDGNPKYQIVNDATGRCLTVAAPLPGSNQTNSTVLLPCLTVEGRTNLASLWEFDRGVTTVTSISSALTGQALAVSNTTLYGASHGQDAFAVSDFAYGISACHVLFRGDLFDPVEGFDLKNPSCVFRPRWTCFAR